MKILKCNFFMKRKKKGKRKGMAARSFFFKCLIFRFYVFNILTFFLRVTLVIILLVLTWHTNKICEVF
jgi:hypothetical protein